MAKKSEGQIPATTEPTQTQDPAPQQTPEPKMGFVPGNTPTEPKTATPADTTQQAKQGEDVSLDQLPTSWQKNIKELREENKARRLENENLTKQFTGLQTSLKKAAGVDDEELKPEEAIEALLEENEALRQEQEAMADEQQQIAAERELGIPDEQAGYFRYLLQEAAGNIGEEEELPDEVLNQIVAKVKQVSASGGMATTSPQANPGGGHQPQNFQETPEEFAKMNMLDRQSLYRKNPTLYQQLFEQARDQKIV